MKKEKFVTDIKKNEFDQTNEALLSLSKALADLNIALGNKENAFDNSIKSKENELSISKQKIEDLKATSTKSIQNIDNLINKLSMVLEKNGTSNDNN